MRLIILRSMIIFFLCVISAPFFMDSFYYSRYEMVNECFMTMHQTLYSQGIDNFTINEIQIISAKFVNSTLLFEETPLIYFESPYLNYSAEDMSIFRESDQYIFTSPTIKHLQKDFYFKAIFNGRRHNSLQSTLGLAAYVWYMILIFFIVYWIQWHIEKQVVIPFNSLFEKIWLIIIDPMVVVSTPNKIEKIAGIYSMAKSKTKQEEMLQQLDDSTP